MTDANVTPGATAASLTGIQASIYVFSRNFFFCSITSDSRAIWVTPVEMNP